MGKPLLPWQKNVLNDALTIDKDGKWKRSTCGVLAARQNGKSQLIRMRCIAGLFIFGEEFQYMITQNRRLSIDHLNEIVKLIESVEWMKKRIKRVSRTNGSEAIEIWCNHYPAQCEPGCNRVRKLGILAATTDGPRGASADFLWIDELREIPEMVWAAAAPTTRARPNAQTFISSNAGDANSTVLNDIRNKALANKSPRLGWYEWSAEPFCRIDDEIEIARANPSLGYLVTWESLEDSIERDNMDTIRTELLCQWVSALDSPWNLDAFDAGTNKAIVMDPNLPTWMGLDLVFNRTEAYLVTVQEKDESLNVFLHKWVKDSPINDKELASEIAVLARQYRARQVAYDPNTAGFIAPHLQRAGIRMEATPWSSAYFSTLCDITMSSMNIGRMVHLGQPELRQHLSACARRPASDGGWRIARRASTNPISAAVALVLAIGHAESPRQKISATVV
jgi:phage terminase large subunit-like protein